MAGTGKWCCPVASDGGLPKVLWWRWFTCPLFGGVGGHGGWSVVLFSLPCDVSTRDAHCHCV